MTPPSLPTPSHIANVLTAADAGITTTSSMNVAVYGAERGAGCLEDVQAKLLGTGQFNSVSIFDVSTFTPSLAEVQAFDSVLVFSDYPYANPGTLGDTMADYAAAGGGVVCSVFEVGDYGSANVIHMQGRWVTDGYVLMDRSNFVEGHASLGTVHDSTHPIMSGVTSFDGGSLSPRPAATTVYSGVNLIAEWSDGHPLVATAEVEGSRRADICFCPISDDVQGQGRLWDPTTDGAKLMANALTWVGKAQSWLTVQTPQNGTVAGATCTDKWIKFDSTNLVPGTYTADILIAHNDSSHSTASIPCRLVVCLDKLQIRSDSDFLSSGALGGPFSPASETYTLTNGGSSSLSWTTSTAKSWLTFAPSSGVLAPGASVPVTVSLNAEANTLAPGVYTTELIFKNVLSGISQPMRMQLTVTPPMRVEVPVPLTIELLPNEKFSIDPGLRIWNDSKTDLTYQLSTELQSATGGNIAVLATNENTFPGGFADVTSKLKSTGQFNDVVVIDVSTATPSLAQLTPFDALLVYNLGGGSYGYADPLALGNVVADYVDSGGGVVTAVFEIAAGSSAMQGRWVSRNYVLMDRSSYVMGSKSTLGTVYNPVHPIMQGVSSFDGGSLSIRPATTSVYPGVERIADWSDGHPLVVAAEVNGHRRADVGFVPLSDDVSGAGYFWNPATDGAKLMANSLTWCKKVTNSTVEWFTVESPHSGTVHPHTSDDKWVKFDSTGLTNGTYNAEIKIINNSLVQPTVTIPVRLNVGNHWRGILQQPIGGQRYKNDAHTFSIKADCGQSTPHYQWKYDDGTKATKDIGSDSPAFTIPFLSTYDIGTYWCTIQYDGATYISDRTSLTVKDHLTITEQPEGTVQGAGNSYTFTVKTAGGYTPLHYQWKKDGVLLQSSPDAPTLALTELMPAQAGQYTVEVVDSSTDVVQSTPATLTITQDIPGCGHCRTGHFTRLTHHLCQKNYAQN